MGNSTIGHSHLDVFENSPNAVFNDLFPSLRTVVATLDGAIQEALVEKTIVSPIKAVYFDFDGVISTGEVWTDQSGVESVCCSRRDSLGLTMLRDKFPDLRLGVITSETNPVVMARCNKLRLPVYIGSTAKSKFEIFQKLLIIPTVYVGDDLNDLDCMASMDVISVCPSNAHKRIKQEADVVLKHKGGKGAVREVCDLLMEGYFDKFAFKYNN